MKSEKDHLNILQVSTSDIGGGAEKLAWKMFNAFKKYGHKPIMAVGNKRSKEENVIAVWQAFEKYIGEFLPDRRIREKIKLWLHKIRYPIQLYDWYYGKEDYNYPESRETIEQLLLGIDLVQCHNLHGGYFDLRMLPWLCREVPVILLMQDAWLLSGHCAHSFECERWRESCGQCPHLNIYPALRRDSTSNNLRRKAEIFAQCQLYVSAPCNWLMDKIKSSIIAPAIIESRIIPNGVDLTIFRPTNKSAARARLGIPEKAKVLLFVAAGIKNNVWKDYVTMRAAVDQVAACFPTEDVLFIARGENARSEKIGRTEIRFVPYSSTDVLEANIAQYYQAADLYLHAAKADTFPNTVLESLACGTPVVATAVGGITEQIADGRSGYLTPRGDAHAMVSSIEELLLNDGKRRMMGDNAVKIARERFDLDIQVNSYLSWYEEILENRKKHEQNIR